MKIPDLHQTYIKNTAKKKTVDFHEIFLCIPTRNTCIYIKDFDSVFFINTRVLKHMYDKQTAEEYDFMCNNVHTAVKYPDTIYKSKDTKRGDFIFRKKFKGKDVLVCVEHDKEKQQLILVTAFYLRKESYLNSYEALMSWEGGVSSIARSN